MTLAEFIKGLDIAAREELAGAAGTSYLHLRNIAFSGKSCGPQLAVGIELSTDCAVRRWDLRPGDWHRIWPELIGAEGAPPIEETVAKAA